MPTITISPESKARAEEVIKSKGLLELRFDCATGEESRYLAQNPKPNVKASEVCVTAYQKAADAFLNGADVSSPSHPYAVFATVLDQKGVAVTEGNILGFLSAYNREAKANPNLAKHSFSMIDVTGRPVINKNTGQPAVFNISTGMIPDVTFMKLVIDAKSAGKRTFESFEAAPMSDITAEPVFEKCLARLDGVTLDDCRHATVSAVRDYLNANEQKIKATARR